MGTAPLSQRPVSSIQKRAFRYGHRAGFHLRQATRGGETDRGVKGCDVVPQGRETVDARSLIAVSTLGIVGDDRVEVLVQAYDSQWVEQNLFAVLQDEGFEPVAELNRSG